MSATLYKDTMDRLRDVAGGLTTTNQGGEAYAIDAFTQARRFLILGSEGGTFYVNEQALTDLNVASIKEALDLDGMRLVDIIVDVSDRALAPKNEPALVALSMAASYTDKNRPDYSQRVRAYALAALPKVARTGTHLFHFADYVDKQRGWGSGLRKAIGNWYLDKSPMALANQVTKYVQRNGWAHADLLRLAHPKATDEVRNAIFKYVVDGELPNEGGNDALTYLAAVEEIKGANEKYAIELIQEFGLPREVVPTTLLKSPRVWEALLLSGGGMPFTAMLRNLATMTRIGLLTQGSNATDFVINRLHDDKLIKQARIHPIDVIKAQFTYRTGRGVKSDATWTPVKAITENLEDTFYKAFGNVEPTGKRVRIALDVSGSMTTGESYNVFDTSYYGGYVGLAGVYGLSPRIASAVLAMVTVRVERNFDIVGFSHKLVPVEISKHDSLRTVMQTIERIPMGGTYCELPITDANATKKEFDAFVVYTDSETGGRNPSAALREYRRARGVHDAKLIVNAMTSNKFSIADPRDRNMLDVVGFDSSAPQVISSFIRGDV